MKRFNSGYIVKSLVAAALLHAGSVNAFTPAPAPLNVGGQVEPNVMFVLDDSGSMEWAYMPDSLKGTFSRTSCTQESRSGDNYWYNCTETGHRYLFSPAMNSVYYDPAETYSAPPGFNNSSFSSAPLDGYNSSSTRVNLSTGFRMIMHRDAYTNGRMDYFYVGAARQAFYYQQNAGCAGSKADSCYTRVNIPAGQQVNFANWFSYYRTRMMAAKAGTITAFHPQTKAIRVGYGTINSASTTVDGTATTSIIRGVRPFEGTDRTAFMNWIRDAQANGPTPLRRALDDAGKYFSRTDSRGPWSTSPGTVGGEEYSCRQNYTILTTDGYWNDAQAGTADARADVDGDTNLNTLADVAAYYWKTDLRTLTNNVPTTQRNRADWQHMVTIGVALGLGDVESPSKEEVFTALDGITEAQHKAGNYFAPLNKAGWWPDPATNTTAGRLLDVLHASANGRGDFFNAQSPKEFAKALSDSLVSVLERSTSNTPRNVSAPRLTEGALIYEAGFNSNGWTGVVKAFRPTESSTGLQLTEAWEAGSLITRLGRNLITHSGGTGNGRGKLLAWGDLTTTERGFFNNDQTLFNYVVGDRSQELPNGSFRKRNSLLGDIVNSTMVVVNRHDFGYNQDQTGIAGYSEYLRQKQLRPPVLYVGANDGFLHAFHGETGKELFAYMPREAMPHVRSLADPSYGHRFFVDGKLHEHDVFTGGAWRTVLVGGMGAGGKSVFALDVTNAETFGAGNVLWEFTDPDMGFSYSEPVVGRLANGTWAAIFGNGHGTKSDGTLLDSVLYVVNVQTGALIQKITLATATGGLSSPNYVYRLMTDSTGKRNPASVARIFVGDLAGNMWRLDANNQGAFASAFSSGQTANPLFRATDGSKAQPIMVKPMIANHPARSGTYLVYFGTGSYSSYSDLQAPALTDLQTFYGVWDHGAGRLNNNNSAPIASRAALEPVRITHEISSPITQEGSAVYEARIVENKGPIDWTQKGGWYIDLRRQGGPAQGERVVYNPAINAGTLWFNTLIPDTDPCLAGGTGWTMGLDMYTGGRRNETINDSRTQRSVFDMNRDGKVDDGDFVTVGGSWAAVSGSRNPGADGFPTGGSYLVGEERCYYMGQVVGCGTRPVAKQLFWEQVHEY